MELHSKRNQTLISSAVMWRWRSSVTWCKGYRPCRNRTFKQNCFLNLLIAKLLNTKQSEEGKKKPSEKKSYRRASLPQSERMESQYPNVKGRDCSQLFASFSAKLEEETAKSGIEITNAIKWGWATVTVNWKAGLLPAEDKKWETVLMLADGPDWAGSTVTGETVFT